MGFIAKFLHSLIFTNITRGDYKMKMVLQEKRNTKKKVSYTWKRRGREGKEGKGRFWRVYVSMNGEFMGQTDW